MKRLIIVGSPRVNGRSAHLAEMLFEANIDEHPEDELFLVPVSEVEIGPCIACDACRSKSNVILKDDEGNEVTVQRHRCVFDDDMQTLYDIIDDVDELTVVSPVFFSGAPAPMKCVLDRLQPYYWAQARAQEKRPATLHVIGEGADPHGYGALVSEVKSALAVAGFRLERVLDWVGKIDENGEIVAEADEVAVPAPGARAASARQEQPAEAEKSPVSSKPRPKLDLSAGYKEPAPSREKQTNAQRSSAKAGSTKKASSSAKRGGNARRGGASRPSGAKGRGGRRGR